MHKGKIVDKIEEDLKGYKLTFPKHMSDRVEDKLNLPPFITTFNNSLKEFKRIPNQKEFTKYYIDKHNILNNNTYNKYIKYIRARLYRVYPSLVRDYHFYYLLKCYYDDEFEYNLYNDYFKGIDFKVKYKGFWFNIHLLVNTVRSNKYRDKKDKRHNYNNKHIDLKLSFNDKKTKKVGDFYLYSKQHIHELKRLMKEEANSSSERGIN